MVPDFVVEARLYCGGEEGTRTRLSRFYVLDPDGTEDTAIFRNGMWCVDTTGNRVADLVFGYGIAGDVPLVGNIG